MSLYKNKYRIESARCQNWDYTSNGYYFVTICTQNREYFLGDVVADKAAGDVPPERLYKDEKITVKT